MGFFFEVSHKEDLDRYLTPYLYLDNENDGFGIGWWKWRAGVFFGGE